MSKLIPGSGLVVSLSWKRERDPGVLDIAEYESSCLQDM